MTKKNMWLLTLSACFMIALCSHATANSITHQDNKHNFSQSGRRQFAGKYFVNATTDGNQISEVCVFCHTPHGASTDNSGTPARGLNTMLWNRVATQGADVYTPYSSSTFSLPATWKPTGISLMCLSCHDGVTAIAVGDPSVGTNVLLNAPGSGNPKVVADTLGGFPTSIGDLYWYEPGVPGHESSGPNLGDTTGPVGSGFENEPVNLSNDHPVSFDWPTAAVYLNDLNPVAGIDPLLRLFGPNHRIECSTCHNVHNDANLPFLAVSNNNSYMCLQCHKK